MTAIHRAIAWAGRGAGAVAWLAFPLVPTCLGGFHHMLGTLTFFEGGRNGPDPYDWKAPTWAMLLGPLLGYGFLAGATWGIGDEPGRSPWWKPWRRRAAWV